MATTEEGKFCLDDGKELYTKTWRPAGAPLAVIVFLHGFSDHCNRYEPLFAPLAAAGLLVHSFDQRGWGRSAAGKAEWGLTGSRAQFLGEIAAFVEAHLPSPAPLFLMGHSMGGQSTLLFAARGPERVRRQIAGYVALSPWVQLHPKAQPSWLRLNAGLAAARLLPRYRMFTKLEPQYMSHDEAANRDWDADPLCHDTSTLEQLAGCLTVADELHGGKIVIEDVEGLHIMLAHGTEDYSTSCEATKSFFERLRVKDKELKLYEGAYHCIYLEPDCKATLQSDILEWIKARLPGASSVASTGTSKL